jgi:hypothetical protein
MGLLLEILEEIRRECIKEEGFTTEVAMDRVLVLRRIEALVRTHARHLVSLIRKEQLLMTPEYLETLPMFDETEEMEWLRDMNQLVRIRDPAKRRRKYTDDLEPLFQNDLLGRILAAVNGDTWLERRLGIPCATSRGLHAKHLLHLEWRPWVNP